MAEQKSQYTGLLGWVDERMPTLMEKYKVPHFDAKGEANAEFTRRAVPTGADPAFIVAHQDHAGKPTRKVLSVGCH